MAFSSTSSSVICLLLLLLLPLIFTGGNAAALFTGLSFASQGEAEAFEDALLRQACFNVSSSSPRAHDAACVSRLDTARGGAGSGPVPVLRAALRDTLGEAVTAAGAVAGLASLSNRAREEMAVRDCVELLGYSVDELGWSLDAMADDDVLVPEHDELSASTRGHRAEEDVHAWLSAALGNQDTCVEGFTTGFGNNNGTAGGDGALLIQVQAAVARLTQLVSNLLAMHKQLRAITPLLHRNNDTGSELPPRVMDVGVDVEVEEDEEMVAMTTRAGPRPKPKNKGRPTTRVDVVVAQDGSGRYRTVSEAVARAPSHSRRRYVIYVKRGVYHENVEVRKKKTNIVIVGEGMGETVISGSRSIAGGWTTFRSATVAVSGAGFIARDLTIRNTAGPAAHQAVALRVDSDRSAFFRVSIEGHQDTLYAHSLRQFYRDCRVSGTVDFVFGNGIAVLQRTLLSTLPLAPGQAGSVTAQGRKDPNQNTGFAFHGCTARGWLEWAAWDRAGLATLFYGEYRNYGPGAGVAGRVRWPGYHLIVDPAVAGRFTVRRFIDGLAWLPGTGVTFTADLFRK
ncbi:hypothetical protein PR202_gb26823 [Eleusine coracana subsp. coracana]|uniref:Pectinesterase n=1 Tax=Eleusine coracana subsp. coracana TaxID=191504 RepID=A0AAV5FTF7_ELECO|nr:hypothetical protein PR202_gb26823 [Eleusine coracana subsp. coracana]